jgi:hypothetical protein
MRHGNRKMKAGRIIQNTPTKKQKAAKQAAEN